MTCDRRRIAALPASCRQPQAGSLCSPENCAQLFEMNLELIPAHELAMSEQAAVFNRAFAGYLAGWQDLDAAGLARFIRGQGIDLCYSRFARANGQVAGFGYINRTGDVSRLAGMGVVPEARRTGTSGFLVSELLAEAKSRSDAAMVLEVFEQNTHALALYRRHNFRELTRLFGWRKVASHANPTGDLQKISLLAANEIKSKCEFPEIPWQVSRHVVLTLADASAYQIDNTCVVIANPINSPVRIFALLGDESRFKEVLSAVMAKFADQEFWAPAIFPERLGEQVFQPLGFAREPLNQILMRRDL